jgi:hypothetical protein
MFGRGGSRRGVLVLAVAFCLAPVLVLATPNTAEAIEAPAPPRPVNILPSTAKAAVTAPEAFLALMLGHMKDPAFQSAVKARQDDLANPTLPAKITPSQTALLAAEKKTFAVPATKFAPMLKVVNGVGTAFVAYEVGTFAGSGVLKLAGLDPKGMVCSNVGTDPIGRMTALIAGQSCEEFSPTPEMQKNADAGPGGYTSPIACIPGGQCYQFLGYSARNTTTRYTCWSVTGAGAIATNLWGNYGTESQSASGRAMFSTTNNCAKTYGPQAGQGDGGGFPNTWNFHSFFASNSTVRSPTVSITEVSGNPPRTLKTTVTDTNGATYSASSRTFTENDPVFDFPPAPALPPGAIPAKTTVTEEGGPTSQPLWEEITTPEYQEMAEFSECMDGSCLLDLVKVGAGSCLMGNADCADWFTAADRDTSYTCRFGTHDVPLSECFVYAPGFNAAQSTSTAPLGDAAGNPIKSDIAPSKDSGAFATPVGDPAASRECFPSGWGVFNPFNWVLQPIRCGLEWAFVPREAKVMASTENIRTAINNSGVGSVQAIITQMGDVGLSEQCGGIPFTFDIYTIHVEDRILAACPGDPLASTAALVKAVAVPAIWSIAALAWVRYIAQIFGYAAFGREADKATINAQRAERAEGKKA